MDDLAERALILEPLLLKGVWDYLCNYPANSKKIPKDLKRAMRRKELAPPTDPDFYSFMRAIPISVRRHIWRYGMTFQVQSDSILNRSSRLLDAAHKWLTKDRKNLELFVAVWGAFPILWELVVLYRVLTTEHYIQTAQKYDACMTHSSKTISYERLGNDEVLYRIGELRRNALAAVRLELNPKRKAARTNLTLQEALTVRKQPEVREFRSLLNEIMQVAHEGHSAMVCKAAKEVHRATRKMATIRRINQIGSFATYLSVPVGAAELLLSLPPIAGLTLSGTSTIVLCSTAKLRRKHSWVTQIR